MSKTYKKWYLRERLVFGLIFILSITGVYAWFNVNEQEDPFFPYRNGFVSIAAPGMAPSAIEDTIIQPLERALAEVDAIAAITSEASDGVASIDIELGESIYKTDKAWDLVREEVNQLKAEFSDITTEFELEDKAQDTAGILLNIDTDLPLGKARSYALYVRDELYKLDEIRKVNIIGDPGEQITVHYPQERMLELGVSPIEITNQIQDANSLKSTGTVKGKIYQRNVTPITRLSNIDELGALGIKTGEGEVFRLDQIATISKNALPVDSESFWVNGKQSIGLSIVIPPNQVRVVEFGESIKALIHRLNSETSDYQLKPIFFQPEWTKKRRDGLSQSLLFSSIAVGIVLFILMSSKLALVVSVTIPAIALTSIAIFGMFDGILQQMSIAGLVISLGLMVDNSIVMAELIAKYRQAGMKPLEASERAIRELYKPLATSTFTTIAAFVPMLLSAGDVADFIRMIPVIVIITIFVSYIYALVFLPTLTNNLKRFNSGKTDFLFRRIGNGLASIGTSYPKIVILGFIAVLAISLSIGEDEAGEFFPKSNRNQAFIDVQGDYGLSLQATKNVVNDIEQVLWRYDQVKNITSFVGSSGPRFYYNMPESPNESHIARVVFETENHESIPEIVDSLNNELKDVFKSIRVHARQIGQGPPIEAPIEVRVLGGSRQLLLAAAEEVFSLVRSHPDIIDARRGYVIGKPKLVIDVDNHNLSRAGLTKSELSDFYAWRTVGITATDIPDERQSLPVVVVDNTDIEGSDFRYLSNTVLLNGENDYFPISLFAHHRFESEPPILTRRNGFNSKVVLADVISFADAEDVLDELMPQLREIEGRYQVSLDFGGEAEEEDDSGRALLQTLPIGIILLFGALIIQFNSYRIAFLVMLTIPLAMVGVGPALTLAGVNFGFMSILGLLALTGVVVNTAIILIDRVIVGIREHEYMLKEAIEQAVQERLRPVLLTAITTTVGMIPLTSPESPLWPPMAWTMIGGLFTSTVLSLIVLPSLMLMTLNEKKIREVS